MNSTQPSIDAVFELLSDRRRRYVLYHLAEVGDEEVLSLDDVADSVAEREREWDDAEPADSADRSEAVRIDLHHDHLPRLADAGLVDYDARTETVRRRDDLSLEGWVPDDSDELPHLRALLGIGDSRDGMSSVENASDGNAGDKNSSVGIAEDENVEDGNAEGGDAG